MMITSNLAFSSQALWREVLKIEHQLAVCGAQRQVYRLRDKLVRRLKSYLWYAMHQFRALEKKRLLKFWQWVGVSVVQFVGKDGLKLSGLMTVLGYSLWCLSALVFGS